MDKQTLLEIAWWVHMATWLIVLPFGLIWAHLAPPPRPRKRDSQNNPTDAPQGRVE